MSNLSSFFGATQQFVQDDPMNQVAFAMYGAGQDAVFPRVGLYNHKLQYLGALHATQDIIGNAGYTQSSYWPGFGASEWTNGLTRATSATTTGAHWPDVGGGPPAVMNGPTGHKQFLCPTSMAQGSGSPFMGAYPHRTGFCAAGVGATFGLDQHYNLFTRYDTTGSKMLGATAGFYIRPNTSHSVLEAYYDNHADTGSGSTNFDYAATESKANRVNLQATGLMSSGSTIRVAIGGVSYNQRSKTLCILERNNSNSAVPWNIVICKNAPDPVDYIAKENEYQVALTAAVAVSGNRIVGPAAINTGWNQSYSGIFGRAILCDDNTVYYFQESNSASTSVQAVVKWNMNAGGTAYEAQDANNVHANANAWAVANYSDWNANWVGFNEYQQSLDGETVITYCSPHLYHGGLRYLLVNLKTGKASKLETAQDTAYSWSVCAFGASNFFLRRNHSTDGGSGVSQHVVSFESYDRFYGGAGHYTGTENTLLINQMSGHRIDAPDVASSFGGLWRNVNYDNRAIVLASKNQYNPGASQ
jgi:hypothetical protein